MLLCFLSVTFWQCQKEELYENLPTPQNKELKVQLLKGSDAQKIASRYKNEINYLKNNYLGKEIGLASRDTSVFSVNYYEILQVSDTLGNTNYTFRVNGHTEANAKTLFNFVINLKEGNIKNFLLKYEMSETFSQDYYNGRKTFDRFQGQLKIIDIGNEGSNPCEDVIVEFNPLEPGGNDGGTYPNYPGQENSNPTIPGTTGGHNIGVIIIGDSGGSSGGSSGGGDGGSTSNPSLFDSDCATLMEVLECFMSGNTWSEENCSCISNPRHFRIGNTTVIENTPDPCGGVIGTVGVLPEVPKDPCNQLKKVSNSSNYAQNIDYLKVKATGPKEHAWAYKYFDGTTSYAPPTVVGHNTANPNTVDIAAFYGVEWLGIFHNHTSGSNATIKMFSPADIKWLFLKAKIKAKYCLDNNKPVDVSEIFLGLVNPNNVYCLKIKDWNKFMLLSPKLDKLTKELEYAYDQSGDSASQVQLQKDILNVLKKHDLGIGLYEQNQSGNWEELNIDPANQNGNPIRIPCN